MSCNQSNVATALPLYGSLPVTLDQTSATDVIPLHANLMPSRSNASLPSIANPLPAKEAFQAYMNRVRATSGLVGDRSLSSIREIIGHEISRNTFD